MRKYLILAIAFLLSIGGMFAGAATNDKWLMVAGAMPGLCAIVGLILIYGRGR